MRMRLVDVNALIAEYDRVHIGEPGKARELMVNAPTIETGPQWIPCSERLPERGRDVLVTRHYNGREDHNKSCNYVEVASCYGEDDDVEWGSFSDEYKMNPRNHTVIAWMPLPEPYEEGE